MLCPKLVGQFVLKVLKLHAALCAGRTAWEEVLTQLDKGHNLSLTSFLFFIDLICDLWIYSAGDINSLNLLVDFLRMKYTGW